jgi:plasmid stabilization system protein ParE
MKYQVVFSPGATVDVRSARRWYQRIDPNLGFQFWVESRTTARRIAQFPCRFSLVNETIRRASLKRFPYAMYYHLTSKLVLIFAVIHERRSDAVWRQRSRH